MDIDTDPATCSDSAQQAAYSRVRLAGGLVGRMWLWFLAGCLVITLVPVLFGWRPYLIESGSMEPRIHVGDVVIASPEQDPQALLGRVAVFTDPDRPDRNKTHRVIEAADDGRLVTKGDANPTPDSQHVAVSDVHGLGRLLVGFVGLPVVWLQSGQWLWLVLFLVSIALSVRWVSRDHEDEQDDAPGDPPTDRMLSAQAAPTRSGLDIAASRPIPLARASHRHRWAWRIGYAVALAAALLLPTSTAAFSATTRSTGNSWSVPNYDYTNEVKALGPYLYWKLDETGTGTTAATDSSGNGRPGEYNGSITKGITGALVTDTPNNAVSLTSANSCINTASSVAATTAPAAFTVAAWFKAPVGYSKGGKLIGFERPRTGVAAPSVGQYDRMLYLDGNARLRFGVYNGGYQLISTAGGWDDNAWHLAVGTMNSAGMALYVDGVRVGTNSNNAAESNTSGWWRAGCGNLAGWASGWSGPNAPPADATPTNYTFQGGLDEAAVWTKALTASEVAFLYFTR